MVIVSDTRGLLVVRQCDHAAMSARAAEVWRRPTCVPESLWPRFLEAVGRHDDGWMPEEDRLCLDDGGRPADFKTLPAALHVPICRRSVELSHRLHPYVTLLVAQHCRSLYRNHPRKPSPEDQATSDRFVDELTRAVEVEVGVLEAGDRDARRAAEPRNRESARRLLGFLDGLSLILLGALPTPESTGPLPFGEEEREISISRNGRGTTLEPWPFLTRAVILEAPAACLARETFASTEELRAALASARTEILRFEMLPSGRPD